jgi:hypothetical protein
MRAAMKRVTKSTAAFFFLLFLFSSAPKELVHEFFHDHESADVICNDESGDHLSIQHQHCELLQLTSPPLFFSVHDFSLAGHTLLTVQACEVICEHRFSFSPFLFFRGPPVS